MDKLIDRFVDTWSPIAKGYQTTYRIVETILNLLLLNPQRTRYSVQGSDFNPQLSA